MKKLTNQLSKQALAVKVQLQEFNQKRRMIRNLLDEGKDTRTGKVSHSCAKSFIIANRVFSNDIIAYLTNLFRLF